MGGANANLRCIQTAVCDITAVHLRVTAALPCETFTINVPNEPPDLFGCFIDDALSATASEDGSWTFSANDLLGNDYDPDVDDVLWYLTHAFSSDLAGSSRRIMGIRRTCLRRRIRGVGSVDIVMPFLMVRW